MTLEVSFDAGKARHYGELGLMLFFFVPIQAHRFLLIFVIAACCARVAPADTPDHQAADFASKTGNIIFLAAGAGLPLISDSHNGNTQALRVADALASSVLVSEGLKNLVHEQRPDSRSHDGFPSGHATAAFAVATMESDRQPGQALFWYLGATLIAASRVRLHRHYPHDVLAGAALGYGMTRLELAAPRGLLLSPFLRSRHDGGDGIQFSVVF